jgi:multiple sugar transport system permease protein/putative chitobiose transport system permease protein
LTRKWTTSAYSYAFQIILALIVLLPIAFALVSSFRPLDDIFKYLSPVTWKTFWPGNVTFEAYENLFALRGFGRTFFNTFFVSAVCVIFGLLVGSMAAFAFSTFEFAGKKTAFAIVILTFMLPFEIIAIPLYSFVNRLGWIDSYSGLIIPNIANGLVIFLFYQFFQDMPKALFESARIDGAAWFRVYSQITMPLSKPVTVSAALLIFIQQWESFLWPLIAVRSKEYKLIQVALSDFVTDIMTYWNEMFAAVVLSIIVPVILLLPLQRYYVEGIANTGSKE